MLNFPDSGPKITGLVSPNARGIGVDYGYLESLRRYLKLWKMATNFACFWPPNCYRGGLPECLDLHYKIDADSGHAAKFRGDQPRELGHPMAN